MDKKKILIVSRAFYPIIAPRAFRATELAKEFARQGHEVVALIHMNSYDYSEFSKKYNIRIRDFVKGKWFDIPKKNGRFFSLLKGCLKYFFIFPDIQLVNLIRKALLKENGYDLLISVAIPYPVHWGVAMAIKKNSNLTKIWVADCGDPFMGNKEQKIQYPFYFKLVEKWFCNKPNFIAVPIKAAINAYPKGCRKKIRIIPQGFRFEKKNNVIVNNEIPTFAYAGTLKKNIRDPRNFLDFLINQRIDFKFVVHTRDVSFFLPYISKLRQKMEIHDYIPREKLLEKMKRMDFLVNFENREKIQRPSKLIDYALTHRPILNINSTNTDWKVAKEFLNGNYHNSLKIQNLSQFKIQNVSKQFLYLL
jgi:hypothetical protein